MKTFFRVIAPIVLSLLLFGCGGKNQIPEPTPVPAEGFVRQSYDIEGLVVADGEASVFGLVLNTGTLDIAYIGFDVELLDSKNNILYEQRVDIVLHAYLVPGDCYPFNCVFPRIYEEDASAIVKVRIGDFVWTP